MAKYFMNEGFYLGQDRNGLWLNILVDEGEDDSDGRVKIHVWNADDPSCEDYTKFDLLTEIGWPCDGWFDLQAGETREIDEVTLQKIRDTKAKYDPEEYPSGKEHRAKIAATLRALADKIEQFRELTDEDGNPVSDRHPDDGAAR